MTLITPGRGRIIIGLLLCCFSGCTYHHDPWTRQDAVRHAALTGLMIIDWQQTREISKKPNEYRESNPILGEHPSRGEVNLYFATMWIVKSVIAGRLPSRWRDDWLWFCIGESAAMVGHNYSIGLKGAW